MESKREMKRGRLHNTKEKQLEEKVGGGIVAHELIVRVRETERGKKKERDG
jgi:hypothetical protein